MMPRREKLARAIWAARPDGGLMGRPFPFADDPVARRTYAMASLDTGKVAACDLCFDYADAVIKVIALEQELEQQNCPGHVASAADPKRCARCGIHIDELRPDDEGIF